jgi:hypothetical protein
MRDKVMWRLEVGDAKSEEEKKRRKRGLNAEFTEIGYRGRGEE